MPVSKRRKRKRSAPKSSQRAIPPTKAVGPPADMRALESVTAGLARAMSGDRRDARSEQAQDLVYEAWEHEGPEREALARRALDIHPDCADAHTILAESADSLDKAIIHYRRGVEAAERTLGPEPFNEDVGHFWGLFETRPYMRARAGLAETLWAAGAYEEALVHLLDLLRLNESDNQGIRFVVLPRLLERGRDEEAAELLDRFEDDATANWAWSRALITFRREGSTLRAELHLQQARNRNIRVEDYLTGLERIPLLLPETVGFGDESEAMVCAAEQLEAWRATPGAIEWIRNVAELPEPPSPPSDLEERRAFLFPSLAGKLHGIDLADLDPTDDDERSILIAGEHPVLHDALDEGLETVEVDGRAMNPRLHLLMHEIVAAQIWDGETDQVWGTATRLSALGYERHDVLHMIASAVADHVWAAMEGKKPVDPDAYARALEELPGSWEQLRKPE